MCSFFCFFQTYVRDIYPFRRSVSPQLNLVHMLPEKGQELIQKQVQRSICRHYTSGKQMWN